MSVRGSRANNRKATCVHFQAMEASSGPVFSREDHCPKLALTDFSLSFFSYENMPCSLSNSTLKESAGETKDTAGPQCALFQSDPYSPTMIPCLTT